MVAYTWSEFDRDAKCIAEWARQRAFKEIYGIPRGGLTLAVVLSHRLALPLILDEQLIGPKTFVVDDIVDSGRSIRELEDRRGAVVVAALYFHRRALRTPDFAVREKTGEFIKFPWETDKSAKVDHHELRR